MSARDLVLVLVAVTCMLVFAALVVVLLRVLDALRDLRREVEILHVETAPLLEDLRSSAADARDVMTEAHRDLRRFDRVLGSAEAINDAVSGSGRVARTALSRPVIKVAALATGTSRTLRRLARRDERDVVPLRRRKGA